MAITIDGDSGVSGVNGSATTPALQGTDSNTGIVFGTDTVQVATGGSTRATVDSAGRVGIGITPSNFGTDVTALELHSASATNSYIALTNSTTGSNGASNGFNIIATGNDAKLFNRENANIILSTNSTDRMKIEGSGRSMFFGEEAVTYMKSDASAGTTHALITGVHGGGSVSLRVWTNGNIQNTNNSYGSLSDSKLKENIVDANSQWDDIKGIRVRNYNFIEGETHTQLGVVAQEIETVSPGLVYETPDRETVQVPVLDENGEAVLDENGEARLTTEDRDLGTVTKSVNYSVLYMKAVKALQEAQTRIETLETQHADLLARVTALEAA